MNIIATVPPASRKFAAAPWFLEGDLVCLPPRFFDDHAERDLPNPKVVRMRGASYWISVTDPATRELLADAEHYAHTDGPDDVDALLKKAAVTTRNRLHTAMHRR